MWLIFAEVLDAVFETFSLPLSPFIEHWLSPLLESAKFIVKLKHVLKLRFICEMWCKHEKDVWFFLFAYTHTHTHSYYSHAMRFNLSNLTLQQTSCKNKLNFLHYSHIHLTRLKSLTMPLNQRCAERKIGEKERWRKSKANSFTWVPMCEAFVHSASGWWWIFSTLACMNEHIKLFWSIQE